jgi:hypothetical protein
VDDTDLEVNASMQELGVFRKLLNIYEVCLVWACGHRAKLGLYSSFGLKRRMGKNGLGRMFKSCFGLGCRPYSKKNTKSGLI